MIMFATALAVIHVTTSQPFFIDAPGVTWDEAKAGCEASASSLLTLGGYNSEDGSDCAPDTLTDTDKIWIGAYWEDDEGWKWSEDDSSFLCPGQSSSDCSIAPLQIRRKNTHNAMFMQLSDGYVRDRSKTNTNTIIGYCCNAPQFCPTWTQIPGSFVHVSVALDGSVWSIDSASVPFRLDRDSFDTTNGAQSQWTEPISPGSNWKVIDAGLDSNVNEVLVLGVHNSATSNMWKRLDYRANVGDNRWHNEGPSPDGTGYIHVSAASDWTGYMIDTNKKVYQRFGNSKVEVTGQSLDVIGVGSSTMIWGVLLSNGHIYERDTNANVWIDHGTAPYGDMFTYVSVASDGTVVAIAEDSKIYYRDGGEWNKICGPLNGLKQVSVRSVDEVWGTDVDGNMFYFKIE